MSSNHKFLVKRALILLGCITILLSVSCKKLVEVPAPVTSISDADVYTSDGTAISAVTGMYMQLSANGDFIGGQTGVMSLWMGLLSDELILYSGQTNYGIQLFYTNALYSSDGNAGAQDYWPNIYPYVFNCNAAIAGLTNSTSLNPAVKQQLLGEAKFMRAFCYFYLVNIYGDVPVATTTDYNVNRLLPRAPADTVYRQMIGDLKDAQNLLSANYLDGSLLNTTGGRIRPTKWAADALLARAYLYTGDWVDAEAEATAVINNTSMFSLTSLNNVFLSNSSEAIWQLQPVNYGQNTPDARIFLLPPSGPGYAEGSFGSLDFQVYLSPNLVNAFEPGDQRRVDWVDSVIANGTTYYYPYKYKVIALNAPVTEYQMVLRLGEQYLIRAEARAQQGNISGAQADLNMIRNRAGLPNTTASDQPSLVKAILHERQVELFTEWGHRWFDLKRTGSIDSVMNGVCAQKGGTWASYKQLFPIPIYDMQHDPHLVQNPGY